LRKVADEWRGLPAGGELSSSRSVSACFFLAAVRPEPQSRRRAVVCRHLCGRRRFPPFSSFPRRQFSTPARLWAVLAFAAMLGGMPSCCGSASAISTACRANRWHPGRDLRPVSSRFDYVIYDLPRGTLAHALTLPGTLGGRGRDERLRGLARPGGKALVDRALVVLLAS
jgi:hypothetical protein